MEIADLLPLLGVGIGWLLNELAGYFRHRLAERAEIGSALTGLLQLESELHRLDTLLRIHKNRPIPWQEYERVRVDTAKRYMGRSDPEKLVGAAITQLAKYDPVHAAALRDVAAMLALAQSVSLQPIASDEPKYIKSLSTLEASVYIGETLLRDLILKLARLHGFRTWVRVKYDWYRRSRSSLARKNREFVQSQIHDLYESEPSNDSGPGKKNS